MNPVYLILGLIGASAAVVGGVFYYNSLQSPEDVKVGEKQAAAQQAVTEQEKTKSADAEVKKTEEVAESTPEATKPAETTEQAVKADNPAKVEAEAEQTKPGFDIVRVEPTGEAVIAGKAAPNTTLNIKNNDEVVAEVKTDASGDFVFIPEKPLEKGSNALSLEEKNGEKTVTSEQTVVVSVPEKQDEEVLVVVVEDGAAARVLQKPEEQKAQEEQVAAVAEAGSDGTTEQTATEKASEDETKVAASTEQSATSTEVAADAEVTKPAEQVAEETTKTAASEELKAAETQTVSETSEQKQEEVAASSQDEKTEEQGTVAKTEAASDENETIVVARIEPKKEETEELAQTASKPVEQAKAEDTPAADVAPTAETTEVPVKIEAVEVEGEKFFAAGSAAPNTKVFAYIDGDFLAEGKAGSEGRWLFEETKKLESGEYKIRIDQLDAAGKVATRSEVNFSIDAVTPQEFADIQGSKNVIIRRSDNLWTISKRLYGQGVRFSAIYQANKDQIQDPDLIFPGQIFALPEDGLAPLVGPQKPKG